MTQHQYRKKPVVIEAWRIDITSPRPAWVTYALGLSESEVGAIDWDPSGDGLWINTLEGAMTGAMGDWLIKGVKGELYSCRADIFAATYEPASTAIAAQQAPIDMVLHCPKCGMQHIDGRDRHPGIAIVGVEIGWTNPPHRSHLCHGCGHIWRPADVATNGVQAVKTTGKADSPITHPATGGAEAAGDAVLVPRQLIESMRDSADDPSTRGFAAGLLAAALASPAVKEAPAVVPADPTARFHGYLCWAWGETDLPYAEVVRDLAGVRNFLIREWLVSEDAQDYDGTLTLPSVMAEIEGRDWNEHGEWSVRFEIGGIRVEPVYGYAALSSPEAPALPAVKESADRMAYEGAREDLLDWKRRALEAENLVRKFTREINGPTFMGEPAVKEASQGEAVREATGLNGLTREEESATASIRGLPNLDEPIYSRRDMSRIVGELERSAANYGFEVHTHIRDGGLMIVPVHQPDDALAATPSMPAPATGGKGDNHG